MRHARGRGLGPLSPGQRGRSCGSPHQALAGDRRPAQRPSSAIGHGRDPASARPARSSSPPEAIQIPIRNRLRIASLPASARSAAAARVASAGSARARSDCARRAASTARRRGRRSGPSPSSGQTGQAFGAPVRAQTARISAGHDRRARRRGRAGRGPARLEPAPASASVSSGGRRHGDRRLALGRARVERDRGRHARALPGRALHRRSVPSSAPTRSCEALEARAVASAAPPTPSSLTLTTSAPSSRRHRHRRAGRPRRACRRWPGTRRPRSRRPPPPESGRRSSGAATTSTGTGGATGQVVERGRQAAVGEDRRMDAAREVAQLLQRERRPPRPPGAPAPPPRARRLGARFSAMRRVSASATRRCWAPSCRSRSMRRRSASAAAMIRERASRRSVISAVSSGSAFEPSSSSASAP